MAGTVSAPMGFAAPAQEPQTDFPATLPEMQQPQDDQAVINQYMIELANKLKKDPKAMAKAKEIAKQLGMPDK